MTQYNSVSALGPLTQDDIRLLQDTFNVSEEDIDFYKNYGVYGVVQKPKNGAPPALYHSAVLGKENQQSLVPVPPQSTVVEQPQPSTVVGQPSPTPQKQESKDYGLNIVPAIKYRRDPRTNKFKPYKAEQPKYRTLAQELGGTNLRGYGGLVALAMAAQGARSHNRALDRAEDRRFKEYQSALDYNKLQAELDKLDIARQLAPYKIEEEKRKQQMQDLVLDESLDLKPVDRILLASGQRPQTDKAQELMMKAVAAEYEAATDPEEKVKLFNILSGLSSGKKYQYGKTKEAIEYPPWMIWKSDEDAEYGYTPL